MNLDSVLVITGIVVLKLLNAEHINRYFENRYLHKNKYDTIVKDIPMDPKGNAEGYYKWKNRIEVKMNLRTLEKGFDSLEIRVWYGQSFSDSVQLVIFKRDQLRWSCEFYDLAFRYEKRRDSIIGIGQKMEKKNPRSGWKDFISKLNKLKIVELPDASQLPNYALCQDGDGVTIEISTQRRYRIYNYSCFASNEGIWQAKNIEKFMELIEYEFNFKRIEAPPLNH